MQHISSYFKEGSSQKARAEIVLDESGYNIHYYNINGDLFKSESFSGKSLRYVEDAAENWAMGIKVLNG